MIPLYTATGIIWSAERCEWLQENHPTFHLKEQVAWLDLSLARAKGWGVVTDATLFTICSEEYDRDFNTWNGRTPIVIQTGSICEAIEYPQGSHFRLERLQLTLPSAEQEFRLRLSPQRAIYLLTIARFTGVFDEDPEGDGFDEFSVRAFLDIRRARAAMVRACGRSPGRVLLDASSSVAVVRKDVEAAIANDRAGDCLWRGWNAESGEEFAVRLRCASIEGGGAP